MARKPALFASLFAGVLAASVLAQTSPTPPAGKGSPGPVAGIADSTLAGPLAANPMGFPFAAHAAPANVYSPMLQRAVSGDGPALAWCARELESAPPELRANPAFGAALIGHLIEHHRQAPWLFELAYDPLRSVERAAPEVRARLEADLSDSALAADPLVLLVRAMALAPRRSVDGNRTARARELLAELRLRFPGHALVRRGDALDWRLEHLAPGARAPDLGLRDVDGNELTLSDLDDKVVLIDAWSFADPEVLQRIEHRRALLQRFRDAPFRILGVGLASDEERFRIDVEELDLTWPTSFERTAEGPAVAAWRLDGGPTTVLIDRQGVVRAIGLEGASLDQSIEHLLSPPPREQAVRPHAEPERRDPPEDNPGGRR